MQEIAAVIFDCDGVLVNSEVIAIRAEREACASIGLDYALDEFAHLFLGLSERDFERALDADRRRRVGDGLPAGFFSALHARKHELFLREVTAIEGVADMVRQLTHKTAVASSSETSKLAMKLRIAGLDGLFAPHIYSADLVNHGKPAPDLFLLAAERLGVSPDHCLVIEDSANGVRAAIAAGADCWGFTGGGHCPPGHDRTLTEAGASAVFDSFAAIKAAYTLIPPGSLASGARA